MVAFKKRNKNWEEKKIDSFAPANNNDRHGWKNSPSSGQYVANALSILQGFSKPS
jgi:hypothetical protein